jgi:chromate transport protein ChrA
MFSEMIKMIFAIFLGATVWQFIAHKDVMWIENMGICLAALFFYLLFEWAKVPYNWKKRKNK